MNRSLQSYQGKNGLRPPSGRPKMNSKVEKQESTNKDNNAISISQDKYDSKDQLQQDHIMIMQQLYQKQKQCEQNGKYVEAASFKRKLQQYKQYVQKSQHQSIIKKHQRERQQIENAHQSQMHQFGQKWEASFQHLYSQIKKIEQDMLARHQEEFQQQKIKDAQGFQNDRRNHFRESATLLNLKKIEQELAKQQNYLQAHQMQIKVQKQEKGELEKWKKEVQYKSKHIQGTLKAKHDNQIRAMKQRVQLLIEQSSKERNLEREKLILKYQNVLKQLQFQQNLQLSKFNKNVKLAQIDKKKPTVGFNKSSSNFGNTSKNGHF